MDEKAYRIPDSNDQTGMDALLSELSHYRRQSERLRKVNELYGRMAGLLDLPTMIETYSIWLAQYVEHELIGYHNLDRERMHMFCSCHGPRRRQVIEIAENRLQAADPGRRQCLAREDGFFSHTWSFASEGCSGVLVLLRHDDHVSGEEMELINESLPVLADPLKRALDYEEIFAQARRDPLTGLPNRLVFEERIDTIMEQARRHHHPLTLAALDLDHFKQINDTMGHLRGDEVLRLVAHALQEQVRITDLLVRMGGDEFLVILPDTDMRAARYLGERLCRAVDALDIRTGSGKLGISIGLAQWQPGMDRAQWMEKADDILYQAKADGRARVKIH
ncbi:MAG TPA: GGDEF domain-containing protein [Desulfobulbus sp.]|nr:GGDEF domain-containing protein [Desulfobulbus sp.]